MGKNQNIYLPEDVYIPHFGKDKELVGVEIGISGAAGSVALLLRLPKLKLYCIDPWRYIENAPFEAGLAQEIQDNGYNISVAKLAPFEERAIVLRKESDDAVNDVPAEIDFVHIDGNHEYEQVMKDINNYMPKIKKGGILSGHDWILRPGVMQAVKELFEESRINLGDDFLWWVYV